MSSAVVTSSPPNLHASNNRNISCSCQVNNLFIIVSGTKLTEVPSQPALQASSNVERCGLIKATPSLLTSHWPKQVVQPHPKLQRGGDGISPGRNEESEYQRTDLMRATPRYCFFSKVFPPNWPSQTQTCSVVSLFYSSSLPSQAPGAGQRSATTRTLWYNQHLSWRVVVCTRPRNQVGQACWLLRWLSVK